MEAQRTTPTVHTVCTWARAGAAPARPTALAAGPPAVAIKAAATPTALATTPLPLPLMPAAPFRMSEVAGMPE
jgi:hypothetical protein